MISSLEPDENLVVLLVISETRWVVWLYKVNIEIPLRNSRRAFIWGTKKKVTGAGGLALLPGKVMLPDFVTRNPGCILALHNPLQRFIVKAVKLTVIQTFSPFVNQGIEVVGFFKIKIKLAIVRIERDKLAADCLDNLFQNSFHMGLQILVRLIAAHFGNQWFIKKKAVTKFLGGCTHRSIDIARGQAMHRKSVNKPQCHRLVLFAGNRIFNT